MAQPTVPGPALQRQATVADWEAVPAPYTAHLIAGQLHVMPKPAPRHAMVEGGLLSTLLDPFHRGQGGPGGWVILSEVDVQLGSEVVALDVAGWRRERMPEVPDEVRISLAPDWVCEVLFPRTEAFDRGGKAAWYARSGVDHMWFVDPTARTLEVYRNDAGTWRPVPPTWRGAVVVSAPPFEALKWSLARLWG
ncbi:MAG: Uma2 family endonuclease [Myxococcaceae bacterium]|nr:MAG: Uma2 family endonuclease [Myxococcaceae bacterium]